MTEPKGVWELTVDNLYMDDGKTYRVGMFPNPSPEMLKYIKGNHIHDGKPVFVFHPEVVDEFDPDATADVAGKPYMGVEITRAKKADLLGINELKVFEGGAKK